MQVGVGQIVIRCHYSHSHGEVVSRPLLAQVCWRKIYYYRLLRKLKTAIADGSRYPSEALTNSFVIKSGKDKLLSRLNTDFHCYSVDAKSIYSRTIRLRQHTTVFLHFRHSLLQIGYDVFHILYAYGQPYKIRSHTCLAQLLI